MNKKISAARMHGFTLVELLVVIGILAILTAIVLVAINPARQIAQSRDTSRRAHINSILGAITAYEADSDQTGGVLTAPRDCDDVLGPNTLGNDGDAGTTDDLDIRTNLVPVYIAELPVDPSTGTEYDDVAGTYDTDYSICLSSVTPRRYRISTTSEVTGDPIVVER